MEDSSWEGVRGGDDEGATGRQKRGGRNECRRGQKRLTREARACVSVALIQVGPLSRVGSEEAN